MKKTANRTWKRATKTHATGAGLLGYSLMNARYLRYRPFPPEKGQAMPIYFKASGLKELAVTDTRMAGYHQGNLCPHIVILSWYFHYLAPLL